MPPHSAWLSQLCRLASPPPGDAELLRRWVERRDEDAFTALVSRHGRMVHGVCCRILGNTHDAEDAFQAVFLTLARKAAGLRHPEALAGWLHGVAVRVSYKARTCALRRRSGNPTLCEPADPHPDPLDALSARELLGLIDREIARLPEAYRLPLVLCDLEEHSQPEAARLLGCTLGSFRGRLLRGRERLRRRLARHGIAPAVLLTALVQGKADAAALATSISRLAVHFSSCPASAEIPASVAELVREGMRGMVLTKLKLASIVLLAACTLAAGARLLVWPAPDPQAAQERKEDKPPPASVSATPPVRHDQAGDPLPADAISRLGTIRFRHGAGIRSIAFTPDGKSLISCGLFDCIRIWDAASGKQIRRLPIDTAGDWPLSVSPDGKLLAIRVRTENPRDESIAIHEFATGRLVRRFGKECLASAVLFSSDGKTLASYRWPQTIDLWDPTTGRLLHTLKGHTDIVWAVAFSGDGKTLVSGSDDKTIRFWDVETGKQLRQINHNQGVGVLAFSSDSKFLATIDVFKTETGWTFDRRVRLWDVATGKETRQLVMPAKAPASDERRWFGSLAFTPDGKVLLTGDTDGVLRFWDPTSGKELRNHPHFACPLSFAFAPDGMRLAVVGGSAMIRLIDLASGKDLLHTQGHRSSVSSIVVSSDCRTIVTASPDGTLRFWETATGREQRQRIVSVDHDLPPQFLPDGATYLAAGSDNMLRVHDLATGEELTVLRGCKPSDFYAVAPALAPDRKMLAAAKDRKEVCSIDPATGAVRHTLTTAKHFVLGMAFTADGRTLVAWEADRSVTVWDVATGKLHRKFTAPSNQGRAPVRAGTLSYYTTALSPDGKVLAFGLQANNPDVKVGVVPLVDTATGKEILRFRELKDGAEILSFSPDGKMLAWSDSRDHSIYLGEIATGRVRRSFAGHLGSVASLAFSADSKMLVSGGYDTTALVWDLTGRLAAGESWGKPLSDEQLKTHWKTLAAEDAAAGYRAVQALAADPVRSVAYLRKHLHPVAPADEKRLQQCIADLESDQFAIREKATLELEKLGPAALDAMRKTLDEKPALETRRRLEPLIEKLQREEWPTSGERLRIWRCLEVLERAGTPEAKEVLTTLANGAPGARQTLGSRAALQRLAQRPARER
jgi:RNA polymerase sigma factor (sigma-70 family)